MNTALKTTGHIRTVKTHTKNSAKCLHIRVYNAVFSMFVLELSTQTPQRGIYEPAREVKDYAAFAPPTNHGSQELEMSPR